MRRASCIGTALGYPDPVKPLMPIWSPDLMRAAASSALMILCARLEFKTRVLVGETIVLMPEAPSVENKSFTLTVLAPLSSVCELDHGGRDIFQGGRRAV